MTGHRFEHDLPDLLADLYLRPAPDYRHDIVRRAARTSQRAAWTFPERWLPMGVLTAARQVRAPLPWRTIGLLALLTLLASGLVALSIGTRTSLPARPYGPAANGVLAFVTAGDIVLADPRSGATRVVIGGPTVDTAPAFSRDGTRLAFLRQTGSTSELWSADATGGDLRRLASDLEPLPFEAGPDPSSWMEWAPDGGSILLSTRSELGRSITIVSNDGTTPPSTLDLGMRAEGPTWRPPHAESILFRGTAVDGFGLYTVRADGTQLEAIVGPAGGEHDLLFFGWSPDGMRLTYQQIEPSGPRLVYVGNSGRASVAITRGESVGPQWSPDGMRVAFYDASQPIIRVAVAHADGTGVRVLQGSGAGPFQWSPDGLAILQMSEAGSGVLLDPTGGPAEPLAAVSGALPGWQRLGR